MNSSVGFRLRLGALALGLLAVTSPAFAQWSRVNELPATTMFTVGSTGDTITVGADSVVFVSTDAGLSWRKSAKPVAKVTSIQATVVRNRRLFAATFGQGVHISDDLGLTWQAFNEGLVGGIANSQLFVSDLQLSGDSLYAATEGAGVYVRNVAHTDTWHHFGNEFEPNQGSNVNDLALGGVRLLASAGSNGFVFRRDPGEADWTVSHLDNVGIHAGVQAYNAAWNGRGWVVGTIFGVFRSVAGQEPWTLSSPDLGLINHSVFATRGHLLFAAFDITNFAVIEHSSDDGATWVDPEVFPDVFVLKMVTVGDVLYAARGDGLWRRSVATVSVPVAGDGAGLRFALAGPQPFGDQTRLRFELAQAGQASIEVFDIRGARAGDRIEGWWSAGPHEISLDARRMSPGVYAARLTAGGASNVIRLVHVR